MKPKTYIDHAADEIMEAMKEIATERGLTFDEAAQATYRAIGAWEEEEINREQYEIERADAICHGRMEA